MPSIIFYSWQSDLPNSINRGLIQKALEWAARDIRSNDSITVEPVIDRDTAEVPGSPDIAATILEKIDKCDVFVCDVSIINPNATTRLTPNPNVLIELGYVLKRLGWSRIIMVLNSEFGGVETLPFDLRMKRVLTYRASEKDQDRTSTRKELQNRLSFALKEIFRHLEKAVENGSEIAPVPTEDDYLWRDTMRQKAMEGYSQSGFTAFVEAFAVLSYPRVNCTQTKLLNAANMSTIKTFGWPIGVMDMNVEHMRPRPIRNGILNSILFEKESYDFWALRGDGSFYLLKTFFEDMGEKNQLYFNTRIARTAEMLMYLFRLYKNLEVPEESTVTFSLRHTGLYGRYLSATSSHPRFRKYGPATENNIESQIVVGLQGLEEATSQHVSELLSPAFILFDFFELPQNTYNEIVEGFKRGRLT